MLYVLLALFFYLNYYLLIPMLYFTRRWWLYVTVIVLCYAALRVLPEVAFAPEAELLALRLEEGVQPVRSSDLLHPPAIPREGILGQFLLVLTLSVLLKTHVRLGEIEREKLLAESESLKAQINPHFLFNTLNTLYALAIQQKDNTAETVWMLSGMMRYSLKDAEAKLVPVAKEIDYISKYIALQRLRIQNPDRVQFIIEGESTGLSIAPFLLIPFVESAFRYGISEDDDARLEVTIAILDRKLTLSVQNTLVSSTFADADVAAEGKQTALRRLQQLYFGKFEFDEEWTSKNHSVWLSITL